MGLFLPPAVTINRFTGGYRPIADYTTLKDTETSDANNTEYDHRGDISQRPGSRKLLRTRLEGSASSTIEPITGHKFFTKLGTTTGFHVVAAGDRLYNYNSSTATVIRSGLTDNSNTFFTFSQVQDPRSASDDIILASNGVDPIQLWNGSGTAILLNSLTSASNVPIAKFIVSHKNRIYAANVTDSTDVDSVVKVTVSSFGTDGAPDPHIYRDSFFCGGSGRQGQINGLRVLNDQILIYTRNSIWKFNPGAGTGALDTLSLQQHEEAVGLLAPFTLVDVGNFHIFLSETGVYAFDGVNLALISDDQNTDIFSDGNLSQLPFAKAEFDKRNNRYVLYYPSSGSNRNDKALVYDINLKLWNPPVTGRTVSYISVFDDSTGNEQMIYGDYRGYLYQDRVGINDGINMGTNGTVEAASISTLTDTDAMFDETGDGLEGLTVRIVSGAGSGQERIIESNTSGVLTLETNWAQVPNDSSTYTVAGIDGVFRTRDYSFGNEDLIKIFREIRTRTKEQGNFNLTLTYIVDFKEVSRATSALITLLVDGFAWGLGVWGSIRWGGLEVIRQKTSLRNTSTQSLIGTHLALRYSNQRANETFSIKGFDVTAKAIGKR